nr:TPA_asm: m88.6 sORF 2 [Murid betaherpesvirus 1]DBA07845.1 TPA_asm: m88.6 sORF 2 [Murid betaherpesvirus 1]
MLHAMRTAAAWFELPSIVTRTCDRNGCRRKIDSSMWDTQSAIDVSELSSRSFRK